MASDGRKYNMSAENKSGFFFVLVIENVRCIFQNCVHSVRPSGLKMNISFVGIR